MLKQETNHNPFYISLQTDFSKQEFENHNI